MIPDTASAVDVPELEDCGQTTHALKGAVVRQPGVPGARVPGDWFGSLNGTDVSVIVPTASMLLPALVGIVKDAGEMLM